MNQTTPFDCYAVAKKISGDLSKVGYVEWRRKIIDAIACGSTSGEILGAIRLSLKQLTNSDVTIPTDLKNEISDLISKIDLALK